MSGLPRVRGGASTGIAGSHRFEVCSKVVEKQDGVDDSLLAMYSVQQW